MKGKRKAGRKEGKEKGWRGRDGDKQGGVREEGWKEGREGGKDEDRKGWGSGSELRRGRGREKEVVRNTVITSLSISKQSVCLSVCLPVCVSICLHCSI